MGQGANPTLIGAFVVGAVVILVGGVIALGGGGLWTERIELVAYFRSSVRGLDVGAPVSLNGVQVGSVDRIVAQYHADRQEVRVPVFFSLMRGTIESYGDRQASTEDVRAELQDLIENKGLRAELQTMSPITGKLFIALVFKPETKPEYQGDQTILEVPTSPSALQEFLSRLEQLQLGELVAEATNAFEAADDLLRSEDTKAAVKAVRATFEDLDELVRDLNEEVEPLSQSIDATLTEARSALSSASDLADGDLRTLIQTTTRDVERISERAVAVLRTVDGILEDRSDLRLQLNRTLEELTDAGRSIRLLATYLEQHPEALLRGRKGK